VIVTRITVALGVVLYVALWALALINGASPGMWNALVVSLVLLALIVGGTGLTSYLDLPRRPGPKFHDPDDRP
jgi:hypothetical protein